MDVLAHDKWLAYTTALLFLELASEYQNSATEAYNTKRVLFEIYSHIDKPDGFYGIQTSELGEF